MQIGLSEASCGNVEGRVAERRRPNAARGQRKAILCQATMGQQGREGGR